MHAHTHTHERMHTHADTSTCACTHTHTRTHTHTCMHTHTHGHMHAHTHVQAHTCTCIRAHTRMCTHMHARMHMHAHAHHLEPGTLYLPFFTVKYLVKSRHFHLPPSPLLEIQLLLLTPRNPPLVPGRILGHPVSGHSPWPLGSTTSLFPTALLVPVFAS